MAPRHKDIRKFFERLRKRYSPAGDLPTAGRKVLELLVFALFLENEPFETALEAFNRIEQNFIDWNEIRVSKASEIAEVTGDYPTALQDGERLRRLLQMIFDKTFRFDLDEYIERGGDELHAFLKSIPFSTRFMNEFLLFCAFASNTIPIDEGALRVLRRLGLVEVKDGAEVVPEFDKLDCNEYLEFFILLHLLGVEMMRDETAEDALAFIVEFDKAAAKRSDAPLVEPEFPTDPRELAAKIAREEKEKSRRNGPPSIKNMREVFDDPDDEEERDEVSPFSESEDQEDEDEAVSLTLNKTEVVVESKSASKADAPAPKKKTPGRPRKKAKSEVEPSSVDEPAAKPAPQEKEEPKPAKTASARKPSKKTASDVAEEPAAPAKRRASSRKSAAAKEEPAKDASEPAAPAKKPSRRAKLSASATPSADEPAPAKKSASRRRATAEKAEPPDPPASESSEPRKSRSKKSAASADDGDGASKVKAIQRRKPR